MFNSNVENDLLKERLQIIKKILDIQSDLRIVNNEIKQFGKKDLEKSLESEKQIVKPLDVNLKGVKNE